MGSILFLVPFLFHLWALAAAATWPVSKPGCPDRCGNVSIPYPFGIGPRCFREEGFEIICHKTGHVWKPFTGNIEVGNISLPLGEALVHKRIAFGCYNKSGSLMRDHSSSPAINLTGSPFRLSDTRNKFTVIGCDAVAYIVSNGSQPSYISGCLSICRSQDRFINGSCSGIGCCQTAIPKDLSYCKVLFDPRLNHITVWSFNPCSYAFVADESWYNFNSSDVYVHELLNRANIHVPIVLDWAIRGEMCENAKRNASVYACVREHSECVDSTNGLGYLCTCSAGYEGNPYIPNGCQDINECEDPNKYACYGLCINYIGSYKCTCPHGTRGSPFVEGGCVQSVLKTVIITGVCVSGGTLFLLATGILLGKKLKGRNIRKRRDKFFRENRGLLLQQLISSDETLIDRMKIFTIDELEKATDNFDSTRVAGGGGHGTVYKGILSDQRVVAIKKSNISDQNETDQFINEVVLLSQINHRNIVKLFGCCLESEVPLLVYEFISDGTLSNHLRVDNYISLDDRLRIAAEIAGALAYLHTSASISIFHRDVKSSNVLLDQHHTAKVSDFGASRSIPQNRSYITTVVQGTCGYLDPEYFQTGLLTEKSDVYSFGVILVELLTRKPPVSSEGPDQEKSLAMHFIYSLKENRLFHILDTQIIDEGKKEEFEAVARLAELCLRLQGKERPTMREVEQNLDHIRRFRKKKYGFQASQCQAITTYMQDDLSIGRSSTSTTEEHNLEKEIELPLIAFGSHATV